MRERKADVRTIIAINDGRFELDDPEEVSVLRGRIERVLQRGGGFVDFTAAGRRPVAVLITPASEVVVSTEVDIEPERDDEIARPFGIHLVEDI